MFLIGRTLEEWKPSLAKLTCSGLNSKDGLASVNNLLASFKCSRNLSKEDLQICQT